jgi:hypothetical protein
MHFNLLRSFIAASFLMLWGCTNNDEFEASMWDYVPVRSAAVFEFNEGGKSLFRLIEHPFFDIPAAYPAGQEPIARLRKLYPKGDIDDSWPIPEKLLMAVATAGADRYEIAFLFKPGELGLIDLQKQLNVENWTEQTYSSTPFLESQSENGLWFLADLNGIWFVSSSRLLLEEAIRKSEQMQQIPLGEGLSRLIESSDKGSDFTIYIQYPEAGGLWKQWFERSRVPELNGIGNWLSLDFVLSPDRMLFTGIINEEVDNLPAIISGTRASDLESQDMIPASAACWSSKYLSQIPEGNWAPLKKASDWIEEDQSCGAFFLPIQRETQYLLPVYFTQTDVDHARELLLNEGVEVSTQVYRDMEILELKTPLDLAPLFNLKRFSSKCQFICVIDETVYFCSESDALKQVINEIQAGENLSSRYGKNPEKHYPSGESNRHIGFQNPGLSYLLQHFVNGAGMPSLAISEEQLSGLRSGGISLLQRSGRTYIKGSLNSGELNESPIQNNWTIGLEGDIIAGPYSMKSHIKGSTVFLVQDTTYTLHLINLQGQKEWEVQLDGRIMGPPQLIDRYKNDKYQYVLNTSGSLYALDRLGRHLDGFPVQLSKPATANVAIVDYDHARNYRLLLACGKSVLNFNTEGNEVKGWVFEDMESNIHRMPLLLQSDQKDYLCFQSENKMRFCGRTGKSRLPEDIDISLYPGNRWWPHPTGNPKLDGFTGLDSKGKLAHVFLNGNIDSSSAEADWFRLFDNYALRVQGGEIGLQKPNGTISIRKQANWKYVKPLLHQARFYLLALDAKNNELHLYDAKGDDLAGFPVYAEGDFTAGDFLKNGQLQIVCTGSGGSIISYRVFIEE